MLGVENLELGVGRWSCARRGREGQVLPRRALNYRLRAGPVSGRTACVGNQSSVLCPFAYALGFTDLHSFPSTPRHLLTQWIFGAHSSSTRHHWQPGSFQETPEQEFAEHLRAGHLQLA